MDIYEIRRNNLQAIIDSQFGGDVRRLATAMDKQPSQIHRHVPKKDDIPPKTIGSSMARQIENAAQMPEGWLDRLHTSEITESPGLYHSMNFEDKAEEQALYFVDEFERILEIRLTTKDKRELFKRMRARYLRQLMDGAKIPETEKEMKAEILDFATFYKLKHST